MRKEIDNNNREVDMKTTDIKDLDINLNGIQGVDAILDMIKVKQKLKNSVSRLIKRNKTNISPVNLVVINKEVTIDIKVKKQINFKDTLFFCDLRNTISKYLMKL